MRRAVGPTPHLGRRDAALLVGAAFVAAAGPVMGKAGLLVTGQSNAGFFLDDGGIRTLNEGLAALLGIERARLNPRLDGIKDLATAARSCCTSRASTRRAGAAAPPVRRSTASSAI